MKPLKNVAASIHQRLLNKARESGRPFNEVVQYYALERWLYRLAQSAYRDQFVLKGALMLLVWKLPVSRPTRDIDLLGRVGNSLDSVREIMAAICQISVPEDGMSFDVGTVVTERIAENADYEGVRAKFEGRLGNTRLPIQIDIGFSDIVTPAPISIEYPVILDHPSPELRAYNRETVIAEKFEAMVKLGELNSRMKDFFDIWTLARTGEFDGGELQLAVEQTFHRRGTPLTADPVCFSDDFAMSVAKATQWRAFLRRNRFGDVPDSFLEIAALVARFLRPIAASSQSGKALSAVWKSGDRWQSHA